MNAFKRRSFIKHSILAGISPTLPDLAVNHLEQPQKRTPSRSANAKKAIIGGGGLGGLCTAYELMKKGHEVMVLEASGRHGGHVFTARDGLSDGLYGDYGMEHITRPGYDRYWQYIDEFDLTALPYPRRKNVQRRIHGVFHSEAMLHDPKILSDLGFNENEIDFLSTHPWWDLKSLYVKPYLSAFTDEYQPFGMGYDHLDQVPIQDIYLEHGASDAALRKLGGTHVSALYELWHAAILHLRGVPLAPPEVFRLKGGNQMLPDAFAQKLGDRVKLNSRITRVSQTQNGVQIEFEQHGKMRNERADYFVNCIPLPSLASVKFDPPLSQERQFILENIRYDSYQRFVFQASSRFWDGHELGINLELDHSDLWSIWQSAEEVDTHRVILLGTGPGGISPLRALAAFREVYPGEDTIEQVVSRDWTKQKFAPNCERLAFPIGTLHKFWPLLMLPEGRIYFAGAYADNLNWGTEACTRSANRVADAIDRL